MRLVTNVIVNREWQARRESIQVWKIYSSKVGRERDTNYDRLFLPGDIWRAS